ncbi:hypothetical protein [Roseospira visakhapatnamensis]|uniref:Uncharacterized protein n=1 Tax=Roseospira visakhapatnamensis TaxID=390880 RepID=A0A7W6RAA2_9PROT|nr:hypothetical protein [Roseospira visakhapatnamensis]MBB4264720.1 hypothetical protein [Roseospira visakhapatnamensis]
MTTPDPLSPPDPSAAVEDPPPALGRGVAIILAVVGAVGLLVLVDLLGMVVAGHAGAFGGGGLLGMLPPPVGSWLAPPPMLLVAPEGHAALAALAVLVAACGHGVARGDAARMAGALDLVAVLAVGVIWAPVVGAVVAGQGAFLALAGWINRGRGPGGGAMVPGVTQAARLLGVCAAVLLVDTTPPALMVALVVAGLAPWALARLLFGRDAAPPVRARRRSASTPDAPSGEPDDRPTAPDPEEAATVDGLVDPVADDDRLLDPVGDAGAEVGDEVGDEGADRMVDPDADRLPPRVVPMAPVTGPFGADAVAETADLVPATDLPEAARVALNAGGGAILAVIRVDGLAGIAEHLGVTGGGVLFTQTSGRLAGALPAGALLAWMGDETFAALVPVAGGTASGDMDSVLGSLGGGLAAPFAADLVVEGRAISMEDAIHVEVTALQVEMLPDLAQWAATPRA